MLARAVCASLAVVMFAYLAFRTDHVRDGTGRPAAPLEYGGISMGNALASIGGAIVAGILYIAGIAIGTAFVAAVATYTVHTVWYW
jgi:hypothetical protein